MVSVFREFEGLTGSSRFFAKGGAGCARRLVEQAFGPESAQKLWTRRSPAAPEAAAGQSRAADSAEYRPAATGQLSARTRIPRPSPWCSPICSRAGGALLKSLPRGAPGQVALRMATLDRISPEVFRESPRPSAPS